MRVPGYTDINFVKWYHTIDSVEDTITCEITYTLRRIIKEAYQYVDYNSYYKGRLELYKINDSEYLLSIIQLPQLLTLWKAANFTCKFYGNVHNIKDEIDNNLEKLSRLGIFI